MAYCTMPPPPRRPDDSTRHNDRPAPATGPFLRRRRGVAAPFAGRVV